MSRRKRAESDVIALCGAVPDAVAVLDAEGDLIGWDESAAHAYVDAAGLPRVVGA